MVTFRIKRSRGGVGAWIAGIFGILFVVAVMAVSIGLPVWLILEIIDYLHRH